MLTVKNTLLDSSMQCMMNCRFINQGLYGKILTFNELIIQKGGKARKYSICAALGNFVLIVIDRILMKKWCSKWCTNGLKWT